MNIEKKIKELEARIRKLEGQVQELQASKGTENPLMYALKKVMNSEVTKKMQEVAKKRLDELSDEKEIKID